MSEADVSAAEAVRRLAFGTYFRLPNPEDFGGGSCVARARRLLDPAASFVARRGGEVVGSIFASRWGSVGYFGPLSVRPDLWDRKVGQRLLEPVLGLFGSWGTRLAGLYTFAESPKHLGTYQKFGFRPRFLTALLSRPVSPVVRPPAAALYSELSPSTREACLSASLDLTDSLYGGLDVRREIVGTEAFGFGDTVMLLEGSRLFGFAVCHAGTGTEAGNDSCYVKFGAVRPGPTAAADFALLIEACEALAAERGGAELVLGMNAGREEAYEQLLARGFRARAHGVAMHRPNEPGYSRPGVYCVDDWR